MHRERARGRERERDRGIDIERERPTDRNFLSSLCLLCSLAGLAALPARLLCWLRLAVLAVIACLLACCWLARWSASAHTLLHAFSIQHLFKHICLYSFFYTDFFYTRFSIQHDFFYTTRPRSFPDSKVTLYLVFLHILIHDRELFFSIQAVLDTFFLYSFFLYNFCLYTFFYTTRFFLYSLIQAIF